MADTVALIPNSFSAKLPLELFMMIKEFIPVSDLRTHVCFYNTCRTFASLYGDSADQAEFWRQSCLYCGLTMLGHDGSYKDLAFDCIVKDGFCPHPQCGGNLLEWNAKQVEKAMASGWDPENEPWQETLDDEDPEPDPPFNIVSNRIFEHIAFRKTEPGFWTTKLDDAFLRCEDGRIPFEKLLLRNHPIATRSLATFPAINRLVLEYDYVYSSNTNSLLNYPSPILVLGVVKAILSVIDNELLVKELSDLMEGAFHSITPTKPVEFTQTLAQFSTLRGLWAVSHWDGLDDRGIREMDLGPRLSYRFSPLPDDLYHRELRDEESLERRPFGR